MSHFRIPAQSTKSTISLAQVPNHPRIPGDEVPLLTVASIVGNKTAFEEVQAGAAFDGTTLPTMRLPARDGFLGCCLPAVPEPNLFLQLRRPIENHAERGRTILGCRDVDQEFRSVWESVEVQKGVRKRRFEAVFSR